MRPDYGGSFEGTSTTSSLRYVFAVATLTGVGSARRRPIMSNGKAAEILATASEYAIRYLMFMLTLQV
jgi:hypothetical protein